jgi:hypothetical protein
VGLNLATMAADPASFDSVSDVSILSDLTIRTLRSPAWREAIGEQCWQVRQELLQRLWTVFKVKLLRFDLNE